VVRPLRALQRWQDEEGLNMKDKALYRLVFAFALMLAFAGWSWGKTYTMQATSIVPGAIGTIEAKADKNGGNTQVELKVEHLAKPALLSPPATSYVVWLQEQGSQPVNQGVLRVGDDQKTELKMTTAASKFSVFVTAEDDARPKSPSNRVILRSDVQE
jgi:hypothetical protein